MGEQDPAQRSCPGGILQGCHEELGVISCRPASIDEDKVLPTLDEERAYMRFEYFWNELHGVSKARQARCNAIETLTLHTIRAFIVSMYKCHKAYSGKDYQGTACQ